MTPSKSTKSQTIKGPLYIQSQYRIKTNISARESQWRSRLGVKLSSKHSLIVENSKNCFTCRVWVAEGYKHVSLKWRRCHEIVQQSWGNSQQDNVQDGWERSGKYLLTSLIWIKLKNSIWFSIEKSWGWLGNQNCL